MSATLRFWEAGRPGLWYGLLGGGLAWLAHLVLAYLIAEFGCVAGWGARTRLGLTPVAWLIIAASVATLSAALFAVWVSVRNERRYRAGGFQDTGEDHPYYYLARTGRIANILFAFIIVVESIPVFFYLRHC